MDLLSVIDVGCGTRPQGNVNCDLFVEGLHRDVTSDKIDYRKIPNFVICDGSYLPFATGSFKIAKSNHTIEHTETPYLFLQELRRVSKRIEMNVPFGCWYDWLWFRVHGHKWSLMPWWYRNALPVGAKVTIRLMWKRTLIRGKKIPLFVYPYLEIHVET
ncbi:MAG: class I SAM-dependent methyltransferase [Thaumarchaeota archaeon]|nr:MAG: class I SAM-dependent methyltransferase [Nitrososphaerota archaeon]